MASQAADTPARVGFVSLGCPKALVDSERILTRLRGDGYDVVGSYRDADLVVVNTCGFIDEAKAESLDAIGEALQENGRVIVTGCLGTDRRQVLERHPAVLAVTGPHQYDAVVREVHRFAPPPAPEHDPFTDLLPPQGIRLTPAHYAYLKISEGCNHRCSFCIIPHLRGNLASRPAAEAMAEAEALAEAGVRELMVISQDTSAYGSDLRYRTSFWQGRPLRTRMTELCQALASLDVWVRLHYVYPYPHVDELIPLMADGQLLPYLDIPFQHASPRILKLMKRPAASEAVLERIGRWRAECPDLVLRSTFIVGFPGETEAEFQELLDFLEAAQIDRVGCFQYSPVAGAAANALPDPVPEERKAERYRRFMEVQSRISAERLRRRIGQRLDVLVDEAEPGQDPIGRSYGEAPEIDGVVHLRRGEGLEPGDLVAARIVDADEHDLYAEPG